MKKLKLSSIFLMMAILLIVGAGTSLATIILPNDITNNNTTNETPNNTTNTITNEIPNNTTANNTINTVNNTVNNVVNNPTNNTTFPNTGVADSTIIFVLIATCTISAMYAYKKVKDYNIR